MKDYPRTGETRVLSRREASRTRTNREKLQSCHCHLSEPTYNWSGSNMEWIALKGSELSATGGV